MNTIQRYVLRQYFRIFLITFCSLLGVYIVADLMGHLSEYLDHSQETGSYWQSLSSYYAARIPWFFDVCSRIVALLAAVLTIGWLQRHNEMTALMAAGISRWRIVQPMVIASVLISAMGAINREVTLPGVRASLCNSFRGLTTNKGEEMTPLYDYETEVLIDGERIVGKTRQILHPQLELPSEWPGFGRNIRAETATFSPATNDLPMGYLLDNITHSLQSEMRLDDLPSYVPSGGVQGRPNETQQGDPQQVETPDVPVVLTPRDFPTLATDQLFLASNLTLEQIQRGRQWLQYSSTRQLIGDLQSRSLDHGADTRVLIHSRFVQPLMDMVLLFLGLPIALSPKTRGLFLSAGKNLLMIVVFTIVVLTSQVLGMHSVVTPAFAAWLPLLILVPVCVALSGPVLR